MRIKKTTTIGIICILIAILAYQIQEFAIMQIMIVAALVCLVLFGKKARRTVRRYARQIIKFGIRSGIKCFLKI